MFLSPHPFNFVLHGKLAVPETDLLKWSMWMETNERQIALTRIGGCVVSTIFLGIDHNWGRGSPLLFETKVFRGGVSGEDWRCETWDEADKLHKYTVAEVRAAIKERVND